MVDFFEKLYIKIRNRNRVLGLLKYYAILRFAIRLLANILIPVFFIATQKNKKYKLENNENLNSKPNMIVVSMTSFPDRIKRVWLVIESILRQTKKPDRIILWLSKEQFPSLNVLSERLLMLRKRGLDIRFVDENLFSHKKYYYTVQEFPNDYMLTIDDDIFYRSTMIEDLMKYSLSYPATVIAQYASYIQNNKGNLKPYNSWALVEHEDLISKNLFLGSGGGTLFPPNSLGSEVQNKFLFNSLTPYADDVWLNAMCKLYGTKIIKIRHYSVFLPVLYLSSWKLSINNIGNNQNDYYLKLVQDYFKQNYKIDPFL